MKIDRSYIDNEDDGKIKWAKNSAASYAVVNKDKLNHYDEAPGYHIFPCTLSGGKPPIAKRALTDRFTDGGSTAYLTVQSSNALGQSANWAYHNLFALQHHDTEPKSAYAFNSHEPHKPAVDFEKFFNGESLDQEDIVL